MIYLTVRPTSGGNYGHQLKDLIGGLAIARFFNLTYVHSYYPYLEFFSLGEGEITVSELPQDIDYIKLGGPFWNGINFTNLHTLFDPIIEKYQEKDVLISIENALRLFPHQTLQWQEQGLIEYEICTDMIQEISKKFQMKHRNNKTPAFDQSKINIAMHINRGQDYDRDKFPEHFSKYTNVRYMFPIAYYKNIIDQIKTNLVQKDFTIHIYTEQLNSEEIVKTFQSNPTIQLHIGVNRDSGNQKAVQDIFFDFVQSDIFVASNSSFSAMACYFRDQKTTIYHPHDHLDGLLSKNVIATDEDGSFDTDKLQNI